jgi:tetratricopeptide (TPR) repeat protein
VKYCHTCGCKLSSGIEKFCPECGQNLIQKEEEVNGIGITDTKGDIIGAGIKGTGNIIGKDIGYTVYGPVIHLNISGNISNEVIDILQKIMNMPTQIDQTLTKDEINYKDIKNKLDETNKTQKQITRILQEVSNIDKKERTNIEEIRAKDIHISRTELLLKEYLLKGNEYYYRKEYNNAIQCYDKALEIEPNDSKAWNNKGTALGQLGNYEEAIKCFDKALEMEPNYAKAWDNKGTAFEKLGNYEEAIQCYDKAIEIQPNDSDTWYNKGIVFYHSGNYEEAIQCYDKALEIEPSDANAWYNKGNVLHKLGNYEEAIQYYDKALEIDPFNDLFIKKKNIILKLGKKETKSN